MSMLEKERVEAASAADAPVLKALNFDILCALGWTSDDRDAYRPDGSRAPFGVPGYVMSLDDAMSLVPAGLRLTFSEWDDEKHLRPRGPWQAILTKAGSGSSFNDMLGYRCDHAATPALAVCASALRARHALALSKGSEG
jgi:hypothetical protein